MDHQSTNSTGQRHNVSPFALTSHAVCVSCTGAAWAAKWEGGEGRALVYRYVWRDDLSDTFDESVRVLLPVERQSVCLVRATVPDPL